MELINGKTYNTPEVFKIVIFEYIDGFCNQQRCLLILALRVSRKRMRFNNNYIEKINVCLSLDNTPSADSIKNLHSV
jgi:hypothetical protein